MRVYCVHLGWLGLCGRSHVCPHPHRVGGGSGELHCPAECVEILVKDDLSAKAAQRRGVGGRQQ
jgi:hypothetical protein